MSNKIMIGRYLQIDSRIHKMSPVAKMMCTIFFMVAVFMANSLKLHVLLALLLMLIIFNTRIPFKYYIKPIINIRWLLVFIAIINILLGVSGEVLTIAILRIVYIIIYTSILTLTTPPNEITYALEIIMLPLKVIGIPVNRIALSLTLALRFIPTIVDQGYKILKSQASRGIDYKYSNLSGKLLALRSLIIPMFSLTMQRADSLAEAMEVRLYNVNRKRINFRQNPWGFYDSFLVMFHMIVLIGIMFEGVVVL